MIRINLRNHGDAPDLGYGYANFDITDETTAYWHVVRDLSVGLTDAQVLANLNARANALWTEAQAIGSPLANDEHQQMIATAFLRSQLSALRNLSPEDAAYAAMGRAMAFKDGASTATINGIVSRATASTYLQGKSEWTGLTAATRAWLVDMLDMMAVLYEVLLVTIRD